MRPGDTHGFSYEVVRRSPAVIGLCSGVGVAFLIFTTMHPLNLLGWVGMIACLALALNFHVIRISIDHETLLISYGIGFIAREFDLHGITDIEMVDNYSLHAVYNHSAQQVPRLHIRDGGSVILPINDTRRLREILRLPRA